MEAIKLSYMELLFTRCGEGLAFHHAQQDCVDAMRAMEGDVKKCFADVVKQDKKTRLAEIILVDGCFIIELLYRNYRKEQDPILLNPFKYYAVQRDLLLLENQIPFFVLENLFEMFVRCIPKVGEIPYPTTLTQCVLSFFGDIMDEEYIAKTEDRYHILTRKREEKREGTPRHILHLLHSCYVPVFIKRIEFEWKIWDKATERYRDLNMQLHNSRLQESIKLQVREKKNLFRLKFSTPRRCFCLWQKGQFEIPPFPINESTKPLLRNLIAFEQCSPGFLSFLTSHAFLMDILIDNVDDVKLLEEAGIIRNCLGSREPVLEIFNDVCKNAVLRDFLYADLWMKVKNFCTPRRVGVRKLMHRYFGNTWIRISVIGAILLFILTFLQTIFTIFS